MSDIQKSRVPNFSTYQKNYLMRLIAYKYADILEDKKTDRASSVSKENTWREIATEFSASSTSGTYRNAVCLKKCYENRKKDIIRTGGGPSKKFKKDESDDLLMTILNKKTLVGLTNPFDDDAEETPILYNKIMNTDVVFEYIIQEEEPIAKSTGSGKSSVPELPDVLTKIKNRPLGETQQSQQIEQITNLENVEIDLEKNGNWNKYTPQQLQTSKSSPLAFPVREATKLCFKNGTKTPTRNPSRRRPATIVKPMTSSDIAKGYDMLLDKRIQLVDTQLTHTVKENDLILQKRKLEIEILERELKNKNDRVSF